MTTSLIWFSVCINLFSCIFASAIDHEPANEAISEQHQQLRRQLNSNKEDLDDERPDIDFNDLMGKFDPNAPITHNIPECLTEPIQNPTKPLILMSLGRTGSTLIWEMLSELTDSKLYGQTIEYVGRNLNGTLHFFDTTIPAMDKINIHDPDDLDQILKFSDAKENEVPGLHNSEHGEWMTNRICRLQRMLPDAIVGFKWKPNLEQFYVSEEARESLQILASLASAAAAVGQDPPIRVIRNRRNELDIIISQLKHYMKPNITPHCEQGDEKCIDSHEEGKLFVKNVPMLFKQVWQLFAKENMTDDMLKELGIPFVPVTYDTLYYPDQNSDRVDEWNKIVQLVKPSSPRMSEADIQASTTLASTTSSRYHDDIIKNWEEVYDVFQGSIVEHLFRLSP
jgi:hypothetical protein